MQFAIRHSIPGRIRLSIPALGTAPRLAHALAAWLDARDWVTSARPNVACASLVINYDRNRAADLIAFLETLRAAKGARWPAHGSSQEKSQVIKRTPKSAASPQNWPLALPTLSLGLAFFTNPIAMTINVPLMLYCGLPIFRRAYRVVTQEHRLNVDFLDTLAIGVSVAQGNMVTGGVITWLIRLGDWIREMTAAGSKRAAAELLEFQAKTAWVMRDGRPVSILASEIHVDDHVVVYPGEMIPVDGEIIEGNALVDQKTITGEGLPVPRGAGETVFAATIVNQGQLTIRAQRTGDSTTAGQIAHLVDSAPIGDTRMQNHAEKFADRLVVPTLGLAVGTAAVTADFNRFLSLVIVDYGTGIRVAAPTTVLASITYAARSGIIIKSGGHMEKLAEVDTIVFDKTGTLSHGVPNVVAISSCNRHIPEDHLLALAAAAESNFKHPVADALRTKMREYDLQPPPADDIAFRVGLGVEGRVNGYYVHVGSERFMKQLGIRTDRIQSDRAAYEERGCSCLYVATDGDISGFIAYEDLIRDESPAVIRTLHAMGVRETIMLTGDNGRVASAVGRRLGLKRQIAEMMPADKAEVVTDLQRKGHRIAMIGDGINDSPALRFADVGIAMRHGADITHEAADVVLMEDSLWKLIKAIEISRDAVGLIKQNYAIVAAMNTVALGLALPGNLIGPIVTALISNGSAVIASVNGMRPAFRRP